MSAVKKPSKPVTVVRKNTPKITGIFIDGINLDRATRRLNRKVEISKLVKSLAAGTKPAVCRYYTIIPFEDDSRHRSYLDAIQRAGVDVVVKRLPPKGIERQVDIYPEMSADLAAFAMGHTNFSGLSTLSDIFGESDFSNTDKIAVPVDVANARRIATIVCPARELHYPICLLHDLKVDTVSADFREAAGKDVLKGAAKWIDLTDSELIWRD